MQFRWYGACLSQGCERRPLDFPDVHEQHLRAARQGQRFRRLDDLRRAVRIAVYRGYELLEHPLFPFPQCPAGLGLPRITAVSGVAISSSDFRSASTPKNQAMTPPMN